VNRSEMNIAQINSLQMNGNCSGQGNEKDNAMRVQSTGNVFLDYSLVSMIGGFACTVCNCLLEIINHYFLLVDAQSCHQSKT
jgi:hypothetical protein